MKAECQTADGRILRFTVDPILDGGGVLQPPLAAMVFNKKCPASPTLRYTLEFDRYDPATATAIYRVAATANVVT